MKAEIRTALVTGGAGFIGSHLSEALVRRGIQVTVVDNYSTSALPNIADITSQIDLYEMEMSHPDFRDLILDRGFDVVFHLAGSASVPRSVEDPKSDFQSNLVTSFTLLETLRLVDSGSALIAVSSAAVYGNPTRIPISENDPTVPLSPYGASKLAVERYVAIYSRLYGLRAASVRPFSAYGPKLRKQIVYDFMRKLNSDPTKLVILGDGSQVRDFVYVDDISQAMIVVMDNAPLQGETYNIATGHGVSTTELAEMLCTVMDVDPDIRYTGKSRPGDPDKWIANIDTATELGYSPKVSLKQGLSRTVEWYQSLSG